MKRARRIGAGKARGNLVDDPVASPGTGRGDLVDEGWTRCGRQRGLSRGPRAGGRRLGRMWTAARACPRADPHGRGLWQRGVRPLSTRATPPTTTTTNIYILKRV